MINLAIDYKVTDFLSSIGWKIELTSPLSFVILDHKDKQVISMCVDRCNCIHLDWGIFKEALEKYFKDFSDNLCDISSDAVDILVKEGILYG